MTPARAAAEQIAAALGGMTRIAEVEATIQRAIDDTTAPCSDLTATVEGINRETDRVLPGQRLRTNAPPWVLLSGEIERLRAKLEAGSTAHAAALARVGEALKLIAISAADCLDGQPEAARERRAVVNAHDVYEWVQQALDALPAAPATQTSERRRPFIAPPYRVEPSDADGHYLIVDATGCVFAKAKSWKCAQWIAAALNTAVADDASASVAQLERELAEVVHKVAWDNWLVVSGYFAHGLDPKAPAAHSLRQPQTPTTGLGAIVGRWPGDETEAEIEAAMRAPAAQATGEGERPDDGDGVETMSAVAHPDCPTCICGKRAPVQKDEVAYLPLGHPQRPAGAHGAGTISWAEHMLAWSGYAARYGRDQSAERIAERGGFSYAELTAYLGREPQTWEPRGWTESESPR